MPSAFHIPGIEIESELGHGAYSAVYRGRRGAVPCAVKIPRNRGRWTRWAYREAVALARVRHAGLPSVIEVGEHGELPYLVMELVEGDTLADRLRQGPLPERDAIDLVTRLLEALSAVHEAGLVHRDVKPRNIIVERGGRLRLVDFGFAMPTERAALHDAAGTPGYTAPEQFHSPSHVDARADLYAVGQVLLECLTGRAPVALEEGASSPPGLAPADALLRSGPIGGVIAGLRAFDAEQRYPDARSVLCDLALVRAGRPALGPGAYEPSPKGAGVLIGRDAELARFARAWSAVDSGRGSILMVEGPRGSGKTRLLRAFAAMARESGRGRVLEAQCRAHDPPLSALRRIFEAYLASMGRVARHDRAADESALRQAASGPLAGFAMLIAPRASLVLGEEPAGVDAAPGGFPEGVSEIIARLARAVGPLVLCVDDVHWADPISRQVLFRLAQRAPALPLLMVLAGRRRSGDGSPWPDLDPASTTRISPAPFDDREIAALVAAHLGDGALKADLARRIRTLADGTPLGVLDVLGAMIDLGAVRPREGGWIIDTARLETVALPEGAHALLESRVKELPLLARRVLQIASLVGTTFDDAVVGSVAEIEARPLREALADACRTGIVESAQRGTHRFVHDTARELLAGALESAEARQLHLRIADAFERGGSDADSSCMAATHYAAAGGVGDAAPRAHRAALAAADVSIRRFDNETALAFLDLAKRTAEPAGVRLAPAFHCNVGEANLRLGILDESLSAFEAGLAVETVREGRAAILSRIAWVEQVRADSGRAWSALERAFCELGSTMPSAGVVGATRTVGAFVAMAFGRPSGGHMGPGLTRSRIELLCELHNQNCRLAREYGRPLGLAGSAVEAVRLGRALGPSRAQARAAVQYSIFLSAIGARAAAAEELAVAERTATQLRDPFTLARCTLSRATGAGFAGDTEQSLHLFRQCLDNYSPWLENNEFCLGVASCELLESLRGKPAEGWAWLERAIERERRSQHQSAAFERVLVHRIRACAGGLDLRLEPESWLSSKVDAAQLAARGSFYRLAAWGPRLRAQVERGDVGPEFEQVVHEFESEGIKPRSAHPTIVEYYVALGHGRVHQFLRATIEDRESKLRLVEKAEADLAALPNHLGFPSHHTFLQGFLAAYRARPQEARRLLAEAEAQAQTEDCPWVLYSIARLRAHRLRDEGKAGPARDQARIAEMLAREHGAEARARWVREEFGLASSAADRTSLGTSVERPNPSGRQLAGLLRLLHSPDMRPEQQAAAMVDDLLRDIDTDRGLILFRPEANTGTRLLIGRDRRGEEWTDVEDWRVEWLESVREASRPWPADERASSHIYGQPIDPKRLMAAPLFLADKPVGAICLERSPGAPAFTNEERDLLRVLSRQMPVSLEIAQLFVERDQLTATLRQAQKMEAVGQVASGLAHEFKQMMVTAQSSLLAITTRAQQPDVREEAAVVADVTLRAKRLVTQLLDFSRQQGGEPAKFAINDAVTNLRILLKRLAGDRVKIAFQLDPEVGNVRLVRTAFEHAMFNLVANARDATTSGGTVTIRTRQGIQAEDAPRRGALPPGPYIEVQVEDDGQGIRPEHLPQVFDPFFTTKPAGSGTGIGLAMVHGFVRDSAGHVEVASEIGRGTKVSMLFPSADELHAAQPAGSVTPLAG